MKTIRVTIDAIDDEGRGRGTFEEFDIAVRGAFVGDDVEMQPERIFAARKLIVGRALNFFERGPCHTERICPHNGPCSACPLHGVDSSLAAEVKRGRIERALSDVGLDFPVDDVIFHPHAFGYRQKVKLMAQVVQGRLRLGVYVPYSHDFVVAEACPYVQPSINTAIHSLLEELKDVVSQELLPIKAVVLRAGRDGVACVVVAKESLSKAMFAALSRAVDKKILLSVTERVQREQTNSILSGEVERQIGPSLIRSLEGGPDVDPDSFCQSDPLQATILYDLVAQFLTQDNVHGRFVDAYAGVGGFTRALQRHGAKDITAVELAKSALSALEQLGVGVVLAPMREALAQLTTEAPFEGIVVDPPKKGLMEDAEPVAALGAKRVALVSCDPDAMASDLKAFLLYSYKIEKIIPIDLFGGTPAIEAVVLMIK